MRARRRPWGRPDRLRSAGSSCPCRFDITRTPNRHIGFGHGKFHCIGAALARRELLTVLEDLPPRLPRLRLYEPRTTLPATDDSKITGGLRRLLVAW